MGRFDETELLTQIALPWATPPSGLGAQLCGWCDCDIYRPASPCSVRLVPGLSEMKTRPGFGDRCKWEAQTREARAPGPG